MTRRGLSRAERDAYLTARTLGDVRAAGQGPTALAGRIARRQIRRRLYAAGAPVVPLPRARRRPVPAAGGAPRLGLLGVLAVLFGLVVLLGGTIACAVSGAWANMLFVLPLGLGPMVWAGRGGRDGLR